MIRAIGLLPLAELAFQTGDALLGLLDGVKGPLEPCHPARQANPLSLQARAEPLEPALLLGTWRARGGGTDDAATWGSHVSCPQGSGAGCDRPGVSAR